MRKLKVVRSSLVVVAICLASTFGHAQVIQTEVQALERVRAYLGALGLPYSVQGASVQRSPGPDPERATFAVVGQQGDFVLTVNSSGALVGYFDLALSEQIKVRAKSQSRNVQTEEQAWTVGELFLQTIGFDSRVYQRQSIRKIGDGVGADDDRNNVSDRWVLDFGQRVPGFTGALNVASLTLDLVSGRIETESASTIWSFDPPRATITKSDALGRFKRMFQDEATRCRDLGQLRLAEAYSWPGDEDVQSRLRLAVHKGGNHSFGSDYGRTLADASKARAAWEFATDRGVFALDAENGKPIYAGLFSGRADVGPRDNGRQPLWRGRRPASPVVAVTLCTLGAFVAGGLATVLFCRVLSRRT